MRKLLFLWFPLLLSTTLQSQVVIFHEDFEQPSGADSVTTNTVSGTGNLWSISTTLAAGGVQSYHNQGMLAQQQYFETNVFSTLNNPFVYLKFNQIAKVYLANTCRIYAYVDTSAGGVGHYKRILVTRNEYEGTSPLYMSNDYFNEGAYNISAQNLNIWNSGVWTGPNSVPNNGWWVTEGFDLSSIIGDTANAYLRFEGLFNFTPPPPATSFLAGWWVDDLEVTISTCELNPPVVDFNLNPAPVPCYPNKPEGSVVADPVNNSYRVGLQATDADSGIDSVALWYSVNGGPYQGLNMTLTNAPQGLYEEDIPNIFPGDIVDWYVIAYDNSCPNSTRSPEAFLPDYQFEISPALPVKCGSPNCGQFPTTITGPWPWTEDFDGPEWGASTDPGNTGTAFRGTWPPYWVVSPGVNLGGFAWGVHTGPTGTPLTGPNGDHTTGAGNFLYVEPSQLRNPAASSIFTTPCIDLTQNTSCLALEFYYHMFGANIGNLRFDIDTGSNAQDFWQFYHRITGPQQTAQNDPWRRGVISLEPFNGKIIRISVFGTINSTGNQGDIAIDDLRIFEPDPIELEALATTKPTDGLCSYGSAEDVDIVIRNNGCRELDSILVAYSINGGAIVRDTIFDTLSLGDTITHIFNPKANLSAFTTYDFKVWVEMPGDANTANDTVFGQRINHEAPITSFPFIEDFDNATPGTQNLGNTDWRFDDGLDPNYQWQVGSDFTVTRNTGPYGGYYYDRSGNYLYTEGTGSTQNVETYFRTACLDFTGMTNPTLDFYYHSYGVDINNLEIEVSLGNQNLDTWNVVAGSTVSGGQQTREWDDWEFKRVDLSAYAGQVIKLRFTGSRQIGGDLTDFAIDKIMIYDRIATDGGIETIDRPRVGVFTTNTLQPTLIVTNHGTTTLNTIPVVVTVTELCGPNAGVVNTYNETLTNANIAAGSTQPIALTSTGITWPTGEFEICAYTNLTGDNLNFNDTVCKHSTGIGTHNIPFSDNFDNCNFSETGFTNTNQGLRQWEQGSPNTGLITAPNSSPNAWVTNLDGPYLNNVHEYLRVPVLQNFDTIVSAELRFFHNFDFGGGGNAAGTIEFEGPNGWEVVGASSSNQNLGVNWHFGPHGNISSAVMNNTPAWEGSTGGNWEFSSYPMSLFNFSPSSLLLRFHMNSNAAAPPTAGWGIDDFELYVPPQNSASPVNVETVNPLPIPGTDQTFEITIENTGAKVLTECIVEVYVNSVSLGTQHIQFTGILSRGDREKHTFNAPWPGNTVTSGPHNICVVTSRPNAKEDNLPPDDSLCDILSVLDEIDLTSSSPDTAYCNDFERTNPALSAWITANSDNYNRNTTSWEWGAPVQISPAHSGNGVWMTGLDSNYASLDRSALFSPIFIVDSDTNYEMDFYHWIQTEKFHDGGNVEVTYDGGLTWYPIGYPVQGKPWYNTLFVTSLGITNPGWSDTTGGWQNANQTMVFDHPGPEVKVIFRMRFGSDFNIQDIGWAIDDFCFKKTSKSPVSVIGGEPEFPSPDQIIVGNLAPNPTSELSELSFYSPQPVNVKIKVVSMIGQPVMDSEREFQRGTNTIELDAQGWKSGMYFVNLEIGSETYTRKLIVTR